MEMTSFSTSIVWWENMSIFSFLIFNAWDVARSRRNVFLYTIFRNQLLGSSEFRFWAILLFCSFKSSISCLLGHFRWFSSFGRYLDRFGLRFCLIYVGISFWDAVSVDFEPDLLLRNKYAIKSTSRSINFETLNPRRSPRRPLGVPRGWNTHPW